MARHHQCSMLGLVRLLAQALVGTRRTRPKVGEELAGRLWSSTTEEAPIWSVAVLPHRAYVWAENWMTGFTAW